MSRDRLFLLPSEFEDADYPGQRFFCRSSALIASLLSSFPELARNIDVQYVEFQRPRQPVVALVGEDNQSLPLLLLGDDVSTHIEANVWNNVRFVSETKQILDALAKRHGFPQPHP
jgi:hypothetical protein